MAEWNLGRRNHGDDLGSFSLSPNHRGMMERQTLNFEKHASQGMLVDDHG